MNETNRASRLRDLTTQIWTHPTTVGVLAGALIMLVLISAYVWTHRPVTVQQFPKTVISQIEGFTFYYFSPSYDADFKLVPNSAHYADSVLVFQLQNSLGNKLAVTEEATPPNFDTSGLKADKNYQNQYGQAYISDLLDRTTGALFTNDGTWILVNAPQPIGADTMQQILDNLRPTKS